MNSVIKICLASLLLSIQAVGLAQTRYVTDDFEIMMRTGPSVQNKIVRPLRSGTKIELLNDDAGNGYSLIETERGQTGYVLTRFLSSERVARIRLAALEAQLQTLRSEPGQLQALLADSQDENRELIRLNTELTDELKAANDELAQIKTVSADTVATFNRNQELEDEVLQLKLENDGLRIDNNDFKDQKDLQYFVYGAGAILLGLFLGWVLSIAKRQRRNSWGA